jgi:hypothetical protein
MMREIFHASATPPLSHTPLSHLLSHEITVLAPSPHTHTASHRMMRCGQCWGEEEEEEEEKADTWERW